MKPGDKLVVTTTDTAGNTSKPTVVVVPGTTSGTGTGTTDIVTSDRVAGKPTSPMNLATNTVRSTGESTGPNAYSNIGKYLPNTGQETELSLLSVATLAGLGAANLLVLKRKKDQD